MRLSAQIRLLASCFLLLASLFLFSIGTANAQTTEPQTQTYQYSPNLAPDVPRDQHSYIQSLTIEVMASMVCQLSGVDMIRKGQKCLGVDPKSGKIGFIDSGGGAIGVMGTFIAATFVPPTSSVEYVRYLSSNFGVSKKAYAATSPCADAGQGVGFCGIRPLVSVWVQMRNIAYLLFVLIFVLVGVAIMLRVHIDPRTVMTIENQIPRIIVGILLVTFSFAIAGVLIDIMYVAIYLVGGVLANAHPNASVPLNAIANSPTPFDAINRLWPGTPGQEAIGGGGFFELAGQGSDTIRNLVTNALNGSGSTDFEPGLFDIIANIFTALVGLIVGIVSALIIFLALIYTAIRLWIILILAYINILLDVVFAPFWFLIGLLPGSSLGVGAWFKDMLANLAVYPTAISMFILAKIFSDIAAATGEKGDALYAGLFIPPLVGGGTGAGSQIFAGVVALGFLFMTPHVLNITRNAIKAPQINYGPVFQPIAAAGGTIRGTAQMGAAAAAPLPGQGRRAAVGRRIFGI